MKKSVNSEYKRIQTLKVERALKVAAIQNNILLY